MKKILALTITSLFMLAAVPAFACDGHKSADTSDADSTVMTSTTESGKTDTTTAKKKKKKADEKKEAAKEDAETTDGEV